MRLLKEPPFENYTAYLNHHSKMNRLQVCLIDQHKNRTTILYSKYLLSIKEKRILTKEEEVDHIDGDKTNNSLDNLQILSRKENQNKYNKTRFRKMVKLICPNCKREFFRERRNTFLVKKNKQTFCSRFCSGKFYKTK